MGKLRQENYIGTRIKHLYDITVTKGFYHAYDIAYPQSSLQGTCIDTGAVRSVYENKQTRSYCHESGIAFKLKPPITTFRLGSVIYKKGGRLEICIPDAHNGFIKFDIYVVLADIYLLVRLQELKKGLLPNYLDNVFEKNITDINYQFSKRMVLFSPLGKITMFTSLERIYDVHIYIFTSKYCSAV